MRLNRVVLFAASVALLASCGSSSQKEVFAETASAPTFSPSDPLKFGAPLAVTITTTTSGATIHYTTDGSEPTAASPAYTAPVTITDTTTLKAIATTSGMNDSAAATLTYTHRPIELAVDDGPWGAGTRAPYSLIALNRFTPAAEDFPFQLRTIRTFSHANSDPIGTPFRLAVYTDADGDPSNGATLEATYDVSELKNDGEWSVFELPNPVTLRGPGDVLIAQIGANKFLFFDAQTSAQRTWNRFSPTPVPDPPVLSPGMVSLYSRNLMVRGSN